MTLQTAASANEITDWIVAHVAAATSCERDEVDTSQSLFALGIDSLTAVSMTADLESFLGREVSPDLLSDHDTIDALVEFLVANQSNSTLSYPHQSQQLPNGDWLATLNARIDALPDSAFELYEPVLTKVEGPWVYVDGRRLLMMSSYSYLGLNGHPVIKDAAHKALDDFGTGTAAARLVGGTLSLHRQLELEIARFKATEDAIVFSSGYMANLATISTLAVEGDWVLGDALNHASLIDGCMHAKARFMPYAHNNMDALEQQLRRAGTCRKLVIVDAVFSMDGDIADLPQTIELCKRYDARLMIDEAHSIGVLGTTGRGLAEHFDVPSRDIDIQMGTLSKAIPSFGGYIAGSRELIKALKFNARGWVFSGALPAPQLAAAIAAIQLIEAEPERVARLRKATSKYVVGLRENGFQIEHTETPIVPIHCSDEKMAFAFAQECKSEGLLFYPIVYPAVPADKPRVRTTMTAGHSDADIDFAVTAMTRAARRADLIA